MRIATQTIADAAIAQIQNLTNQQTQLQQQVSTGQRIFNPSDDPTATGQVLNLDNQSRQIQQYQKNAGTALDLANASYAGLSSINSLATRAGEIATLGQGVNGTTGNSDYASEVNQLIEQALQTANSKSGNNYLYAGTAVNTAPFTATRDASGQITAVTYGGNSGQASIAISDNTSVSPGTTGATNTSIGDFINQLVSLRNALTSSDTAGIASASQAVNASGDTLSDAVGENGAIQFRIQAAQTQLTSLSQTLGQSASNTINVDMASTIVKLNQASTSYQAALSSTSKILQMSLLNYLSTT